MPPKKASTTGTKKAATQSNHASYQDMIIDAIQKLKERTGSSRQALKKYVQANNDLSGVSDNQFTAQFNKALQRGSDNGVFDRPKGPSGPVKLAMPKKSGAAAPSSTKSTTKSTATKAPAKAKTTTTATATKKAPAKAATKKSTTATKKAPAKKSTTTQSKTTANKSKARKTPAAAPAVEEKAPVVLTKTKTGRVVKSAAPSATTAKKPATKKKASAKKATPKKSATPKAKA